MLHEYWQSFFLYLKEGVRVLIQKRCPTSHLPLDPPQVTMALWFEEGGVGKRSCQQRAHRLLSVPGCSLCGSPRQLFWLRPSAATGEALWEIALGQRSWADRLVTRVPSAISTAERLGLTLSPFTWLVRSPPCQLCLLSSGSSRSQSNLYEASEIL